MNIPFQTESDNIFMFYVSTIIKLHADDITIISDNEVILIMVFGIFIKRLNLELHCICHSVILSSSPLTYIYAILFYYH